MQRASIPHFAPWFAGLQKCQPFTDLFMYILTSLALLTSLGLSSVCELKHFLPLQTCREGNTALHLACQSNQLRVIEVLLQWGARANMTNASGFAPVSTFLQPSSLQSTFCA